MQFSLLFELQCADASPDAEHQTLRDCVEQAVYAEAMGFDRIWAVEHHSLKWYAHMSAPEIFLAWVAARTERIRIGHGVVCMPFGYNHPLRVAEKAGMLDSLSGGRLDLGAGRGATQMEMSGFGVVRADTEPQVEEALRIISRCWRSDEFEWHGSIDIEPRTVLPRPQQLPHPPLFLACTKDETVRRAADYGVGALVLGFSGPGQVGELRRVYDEGIAARGGDRFVSDDTNDHLSALCPTLVLDDAEQAFQIGARGQKFFAEAIQHWNVGTPAPELVPPGIDIRDAVVEAKARVEATMVEGGHPIPVIASATGPFNIDHAYGDRDDAIRYVRALGAAGADEIMCIVQMGGVPHAAVMETIRQYGEYVIPAFRG
ncbi:MAG: LLM class flavin-dependent oxidoreductase [Acidimicrobiia bacterium]|nr:LLM class flavin-dependent oxidoreductase [Acidimicrobiia bacterium]